MDIRTFGLYETKYYWRSQEEFKVKYIKARIAEVTSDGEKLIVKGEDTLVKRPITIPFDLVVHAIGMDPNVDNPEISDVFGVGLEEHGHIEAANRYGAMGQTDAARCLRCRRCHGTGNNRRLDRTGTRCSDGGAFGTQGSGSLGRLLFACPFFLQSSLSKSSDLFSRYRATHCVRLCRLWSLVPKTTEVSSATSTR
jgi:hypothetical protein